MSSKKEKFVFHAFMDPDIKTYAELAETLGIKESSAKTKFSVVRKELVQSGVPAESIRKLSGAAEKKSYKEIYEGLSNGQQ